MDRLVKSSAHRLTFFRLMRLVCDEYINNSKHRPDARPSTEELAAMANRDGRLKIGRVTEICIKCYVFMWRVILYEVLKTIDFVGVVYFSLN